MFFAVGHAQSAPFACAAASPSLWHRICWTWKASLENMSTCDSRGIAGQVLPFAWKSFWGLLRQCPSLGDCIVPYIA